MKDQCLKELYEMGAIKFGEFKLKSGQISPVYIDLRVTISNPELLEKLATLMWQMLPEKKFDRVCGVPYTALPFATVLSIQERLPMVMRRKEAKDYGTRKEIEGLFEPGQNCLLLEDVVTSGGSVFETIKPLEDAGLSITDVVVIVDREQGGRESIEQKGYRFHALYTLSEILEKGTQYA